MPSVKTSLAVPSKTFEQTLVAPEHILDLTRDGQFSFHFQLLTAQWHTLPSLKLFKLYTMLNTMPCFTFGFWKTSAKLKKKIPGIFRAVIAQIFGFKSSFYWTNNATNKFCIWIWKEFCEVTLLRWGGSLYNTLVSFYTAHQPRKKTRESVMRLTEMRFMSSCLRWSTQRRTACLYHVSRATGFPSRVSSERESVSPQQPSWWRLNQSIGKKDLSKKVQTSTVAFPGERSQAKARVGNIWGAFWHCLKRK